MKKILLSLLVTSVVAVLAIKATGAFFSDTETSSGNILKAGAIDLKIDNTSYYNHVLSESTSWLLSDLDNKLFFNFTDLKPSDLGEDTISIHVEDNDAWACMQVNLTKNSDNTCTEPESLDDPTCAEPGEDLGELGDELNFAFWVDDGDNILEANETAFKEGSAIALFNNSKWVLADSSDNLFEPVGSLLGAKTYYIGKAWCFGTLTKSPLAQDGFGAGGPNTPANTTGGVLCDGISLNNETQTDILMGDITFSAFQSRNNPDFLCNPASPTPSPSPTPLLACETVWADGVLSSAQGNRKDGTDVLADRSDTSDALGIAQSLGAASDVPVVAGSFYSLGFTNGSIILSFTNPFFDIPGADIQIYEVTGGTYPDEKVKVEASLDGISWTLLSSGVTRDGSVDMNGLIASAKYLRLTDVSNIALFEPTADAYDLDGVKVFCGSD